VLEEREAGSGMAGVAGRSPACMCAAIFLRQTLGTSPGKRLGTTHNKLSCVKGVFYGT
jgi:hypothetical protein